MAPPRQTHVHGHPIKLPLDVYTSAVKAAELQGMTPEQWLTGAARDKLAENRAAFKADNYWHLRRLAEMSDKPMPIAHEHGLPEEFDTSSPPLKPSPFIKFRR